VDDAIALAKKQLKNIYKGTNVLPEGVVIRSIEDELYLKNDGDFLLDIMVEMKIVRKTTCSIENQLMPIIIYC
jgi:hypothetical protein